MLQVELNAAESKKMATQQQDAQNVETGVDRLITFLKGKGQVPIKDVAKSLNVSEDLAHYWIDFLVEEKILGMEYKLTNPYVYIIKKEEDTAITKSIIGYKKDFEEDAKNKNIPDNKTEYLWKQHVLQHLDGMKQFFLDEAKKRQITKSEELWQEYENRIIGS